MNVFDVILELLGHARSRNQERPSHAAALRAVRDLHAAAEESLGAWDGEEDSVKDEHAVTIERLRKALRPFESSLL